jgi:predicted RNA polymerase sigma factor
MSWAASAAGDRMSRWHLEAGIAYEHAVAPSVRETDWGRIVAFYDLLMAQSPGPIVVLNRALPWPSVTGWRKADASSSPLRAKRS